MYFVADDITRLIRTVNNELKKVKVWIDCNKLAINIEKTNIDFSIHPKGKQQIWFLSNLAKKIYKELRL